MNARDIFAANIEFSCDQRIAFNYTRGEDRLNDMGSYGLKHHAFERKVWEEDGFEYSTDMWGNTWYRVIGRSETGEVFKPVLEDWNTLDSLELPQLDDPVNFKSISERAERETDLFRCGFMPGWPFATCRYMRKMEIYFMDLIAERERIDILHDRVTSLFERVIDQFATAHMDGIFFFEDLGVQDRLLMSPDMWRDIYRPLYERLTSRAHGHGMKVIQHSCGYNWELIDDLCMAGVDCLQFDQPTIYDMPALSEKLKHHGVGLFSPCDIQKVLPTGDRDYIEKESRRLVDTFRGGLIVKNYPDLPGIGVKPEYDQWAYDAFVAAGT